jgi:hypothetical protein
MSLADNSETDTLGGAGMKVDCNVIGVRDIYFLVDVVFLAEPVVGPRLLGVNFIRILHIASMCGEKMSEQD